MFCCSLSLIDGASFSIDLLHDVTYTKKIIAKLPNYSQAFVTIYANLRLNFIQVFVCLFQIHVFVIINGGMRHWFERVSTILGIRHKHLKLCLLKDWLTQWWSSCTHVIFYKEPSSGLSSLSSTFLGLILPNCSTKNSLQVP